MKLEFNRENFDNLIEENNKFKKSIIQRDILREMEYVKRVYGGKGCPWKKYEKEHTGVKTRFGNCNLPCPECKKDFWKKAEEYIINRNNKGVEFYE